MTKTHYYVVCEDCGANLDPGERCDCRNHKDAIIHFVCDRRKCHSCHPECSHTTDIKHAKNFTVSGVDDLYFEEDDYECQE